MQPSFEIDVFLSRKSQDSHLAKEIYDFLTSHGLKVFDSDHTLTEIGNADYSEAIDEALVKCKHLIVVSSQADYINSEWVKAEWRFFLNQKRSNKKSGNLLTIITGQLTIDDLPASLQNYEVIPFETHQKRILSYLGGSKKIITDPIIQKEEIPIDKNENKNKQTDNRIHTEEIYQKGKEHYDNKEYSEAIIYIMKAADEDHAEAQNLLGYMYQESQGVNKDHKTAMKWYKKAADQGLAEAEKNIGRAYHLGFGRKIDYEEAENWYLKSEEKGNMHAINNLGLLYIFYENRINIELGLLKLSILVENNNGMAQNNLGFLYLNGIGVNRNYDEALKFFLKSKDNDNLISNINLGLLYIYGYGVKSDNFKALTLLKIPAELGDYYAQELYIIALKKVISNFNSKNDLLSKMRNFKRIEIFTQELKNKESNWALSKYNFYFKNDKVYNGKIEL